MGGGTQPGWRAGRGDVALLRCGTAPVRVGDWNNRTGTASPGSAVAGV